MTSVKDGGIDPFLRASEALVFDRGNILWLWDTSVKQWRSIQRHGYPTKDWEDLILEYGPLSVYDGSELKALREDLRDWLLDAEGKRWPAAVVSALKNLIWEIDHVRWSPTMEKKRFSWVDDRWMDEIKAER